MDVCRDDMNPLCVVHTLYYDGYGMSYSLSLDEEYIVKASFIRDNEQDGIFEFDSLPQDMKNIIFGYLDDDLVAIWRSRRVCRKWKSDLENLVQDNDFVSRVSKPDISGDSLLHLACFSSREETGFSLVMSFLNRGGSTKALQEKNNLGYTPLDFAIGTSFITTHKQNENTTISSC